jgi:hypothetical protein
MEPRKVIGSVDASEVVVAGAASIGFLIGLSSSGFVLPLVAALLAGGLVAAPIAAYLVRLVPAQLLGAIVGGMIILTNARTIMKAAELDGGPRATVYVLVLIAWGVAVTLAARALRRTRREEALAATVAPADDRVLIGATAPVGDTRPGD